MENVKVDTTIAGHRFTAEGPEAVVQEQFRAWLDAVKGLAVAPPTAEQKVPEGSNGGIPRARPLIDANAEQMAAAFSQDERNGRKLITLKYPPNGDERAQTAMVLLLFGFKQLAGQDEVPVMTLKDALEQSGLRIDRVDRIAYLPVKNGLVLKGGKKGPGGSYRLTNAGITRAQADLKQLLEQI